MQPLIVDAHQDIATNILVHGRDYTRAVQETRQLEIGSETPERNGNALLGWPEYQRGRVGVVFATLFAPPVRPHTESWQGCYKNADEAHRLYRDQLETYFRLTDQHPDKFHLVRTAEDLETVLAHWEDDNQENHPVGLVALMEGAEGVRSPDELEEWWELGLRAIGLAWAGTRFCGGTREPGPLTPEGQTLLEAMGDIGFLLDLSHMDSQAAYQALDHYAGEIVATHANAAALLKNYDGNRHLPDGVIHKLLERDGVVGIVPYNAFLLPGWQKSDGRHLVTLQHVAAQIDYICQMAGDSAHVGLGSDFDGGFGVESVPDQVDTIADLQKLVPILVEKGYSETDIAAVFGGNWLRKLRSILPEDE
jgi:membrane dipeptidase